MHANISLPPDALARQEMLKRHQTKAKKDANARQPLEQKQQRERAPHVPDKSAE